MAGDDGVDRRRRQLLAAEAADDVLHAATTEAVQGEARDMGMAGQLRLVIGPAGHQQKHPGVGDAVQAVLDQLQGGRVDPVGVLDDHQHGLSSGQADELRGQRLQGARPLRLGRQIDGGVAAAAVQAEQRGDQGRALAAVTALAEQRFQPVQLGVGARRRRRDRQRARSVGSPAQSAVDVVGRALVTQAGVGCAGQMIEQRRR